MTKIEEISAKKMKFKIRLVAENDSVGQNSAGRPSSNPLYCLFFLAHFFFIKVTHIETLNFARRFLKIFRAGCDFFTEIFSRGVRFFLLKFFCVGAIFLLKFFRAECDTQAIIFWVRICSHLVLAQHPVHSPFFENYSSVTGPFLRKIPPF